MTLPFSHQQKTCIGIYVFKRAFNVLHMLEKSVSMQQHFEQNVGKQRRLEEKYLDISEA